MFIFLQWLLCHDATNGLGQVRQRDPDLRFVKKKLHDRILGPKILHTKSAWIATIFTQKEAALMH